MGSKLSIQKESSFWGGMANDQLSKNHVLPLKTATTIAMNCLSKDLTRQARHEFLAGRMHAARGQDINSEIEKKAKAAFAALLEKVDQLLIDYDEKPKILIENYRTNTTNPGTNSTHDLSAYYREKAEKHKLAIMVIPATDAKFQDTIYEYKEGQRFDLYNKGKKEGKPTEWGDIEAQAQALFWLLVASSERFFGVIGGRSGSLDVAAFCGVKCLYWDEPWIEYAARSELWNAHFSNWNPGVINESHISQCLRSLELSEIMASALPGTKVKDTAWSTLQEEQVDAWFKEVPLPRYAWKKAIYPPRPTILQENWCAVSPLLSFLGLFEGFPPLIHAV